MIPILLWPRRSLATFNVRSRGQHVRGVGVPQIVEPITGQDSGPNRSNPFMSNEGWLHWATVL